MPWRSVSMADERERFIATIVEGRYSKRTVFQMFGISPRTGYKWLSRFKEYGPQGLRDMAPIARTYPHRTRPEIAQLLIRCREQHRTWGAEKLLGYLQPKHPQITFPVPSTVSEILKRAGLVRARRRRPPSERWNSPFSGIKGPNDTWYTDFKGHFKLLSGQRCHPLTITDAFSRYCLNIKALASEKSTSTKRAFERTFREHGLPLVIRSDNGAPFSSPGGLSPLSVWFIKLGIELERIEPGKPQQNGSHERFHRTLKYEATRPPKRSLETQQKVFNAFIEEYNNDRPHKALNQQTPASVYTSSPRSYAAKIAAPEYPDHFEVRKVVAGGNFRFSGRLYFASHSLAHETIGLEPVDDGLWKAYFYKHPIGFLEECTKKFRRMI